MKLRITLENGHENKYREPIDVELGEDWFQFTYGDLRTSPNGDFGPVFFDHDWQVEGESGVWTDAIFQIIP